MSRSTQVVLLCEDEQHEAFARRLLRGLGWDSRKIRVERSPSGRGSAEQYVRERFPRELQAMRSRHGKSAHLVVMIDGDSQGVARRRASLVAACRTKNVAPPSDADPVVISVPTWNIETWLAYLGGETIDESRGDYQRLPRAKDCRPMVRVLLDMCREGSLRPPYPQSLEDTCIQYRRAFG